MTHQRIPQHSRIVPPHRYIAIGWSIAMATALGGCDPLVDNAFPGDPLQRISGEVALQAPESADILLAWVPLEGWTTESPITVHLGETFQGSNYLLSVVATPPESALDQLDRFAGSKPGNAQREAKLAIGTVLVVSPAIFGPEATAATVAEIEGDDIARGLRGGPDDMIILYADRPVEQGSAAYRMIGNELQPGFHSLAIEERPAEDVAVALRCELRSETWREWLACPPAGPHLYPRNIEVDGPTIVQRTEIETLVDWQTIFPQPGADSVSWVPTT